MEVMALDVAITVPGGPEALKTLTNIESAGKKTASSMSQSFSKSSQEIIDAIMKSGSASAKAHLQSQLAAKTSAAQIVATTQQRTMKEIQAEANLANHFRQMRDREIAAAEKAAYAIDAAMKRQNRTVTMSTAGFQKWGNAAIRGAGALTLIADSAANSDKSFQSFLKTGSSIAFMFGPAGAVVGSIGIAASMIVSGMDKARKAIDDVKKATDQLVASGREMASAPGFASFGSAKSTSFQMGVRIADLVDQLEALEKLERSFQQSSRIAIAAGQTTPLNRSFDVNQIGSLKSQIAELRTAKTAVDQLAGVLSTYEATQRKANVAAKEMVFNTPATIAGQGLGMPGLNTGGVGAPQFGGAADVVARNMATLSSAADQAILDARAEIEESIDEHLNRGLGNAIEAAFSRAFSGEGLSGLFKGFTSSILGSLGQMFIELGKHLIGFGAIMESLKKGLTSIFSSGPASLVAGAALIALGSAMSAGAGKILSGGGSRGGGGSGSYSSAQALTDNTSRYSLNPNTWDMTKVQPYAPIQFTIIGTNDVRAQNDIADMVTRAQRRGAGRG